MQVSRNFFGAQIHSFEMKIDGPPGFQKEPYNAIFIRAPAIISVEDSIEVLSQLRNAKPADGSDPTDVVVAARKVSLQRPNFE
jgi:5'-phosphate synthase pdxT subunit